MDGEGTAAGDRVPNVTRVLGELCALAVAGAVVVSWAGAVYGAPAPSRPVLMTGLAVLCAWAVERATAVPVGLDRAGRLQRISGVNAVLFPAAILLPPLGFLIVGTLSSLPHLRGPGPVRAGGTALLRMITMTVAACVFTMANSGPAPTGSVAWLAPQALVALVSAGMAMLLAETALTARVVRVAAGLGPEEARTFEGPPLLRDSFDIAVGALVCLLHSALLALILLVPLVGARYRSARYHASALDGYRDHKTGLLTLTAFHDLATKELSRARRSGAPVSLLMLDLDGLKRVNSRHGHLAGDTYIQAMGRVLQDCVRVEDLVARFGGDEFCILLPDATLEQALGVGERVRTRAAATVLAGLGQSLGVSVGVTGAVPDDTIDTLISRADQGLLAAKARGKDRVVPVSATSPVGVGGQRA